MQYVDGGVITFGGQLRQRGRAADYLNLGTCFGLKAGDYMVAQSLLIGSAPDLNHQGLAGVGQASTALAGGGSSAIGDRGISAGLSAPAAATGGQRQDHRGAEQQSSDLFHLIFSFRF